MVCEPSTQGFEINAWVKGLEFFQATCRLETLENLIFRDRDRLDPTILRSLQRFVIREVVSSACHACG